MYPFAGATGAQADRIANPSSNSAVGGQRKESNDLFVRHQTAGEYKQAMYVLCKLHMCCYVLCLKEPLCLYAFSLV